MSADPADGELMMRSYGVSTLGALCNSCLITIAPDRDLPVPDSE